MNQRQHPEIDALGVPAGDEALVWPDRADLGQLAEDNRRLRASYRFEIAGRPIRDLLGGQIRAPLVIAAGHQPSFFHPGVWAKTVAASYLADRLNGHAHFLVVDSDEVEQPAIAWPEAVGDSWRAVSLAMPGAKTGQSYEQLPILTSPAWSTLFNQIPQPRQSDRESALSIFTRGFLADEGPGRESGPPGYVSRWIGGMAALERALQLRAPQYVCVSDLFSCRDAEDATSVSGAPGGPEFVAHVLLNASGFAAAYNAALADYRRRRGIRGSRHPIPDLGMDGESVELPFWAVRDGQLRQRVSAKTEGPDSIRLTGAAGATMRLSRSRLAAEPLTELHESLNSWRLRPRALALTMFARLLGCDLFIHGIGGAKYDQITDEIIRRFFGVEPPRYACVSATLRLDLTTFGVTRADCLAARRELRDLRYNPQRHLPAEASQPELGGILANRERAVAESLRLRQRQRRNRAARRAAFEHIRKASAAALAAVPGFAEQIQQRLLRSTAQLGSDRVALSREWFVGLYPMDKLKDLSEGLREIAGRREAAC